MHIIARIMLISTLSVFYIMTVDMTHYTTIVSHKNRAKDGLGRLRALLKRIRPTPSGIFEIEESF